MITDINNVILRVNKAFADSTGYTAEEAVGQTPRILKSGRHTEEFYREMWRAIHQTGAWQGEIWDRRKNGDIYPTWLTISAVKGANGVVTHYVGSHIDITERKAAEKKIQHLAFYDALTRLPNRRLLMDRLQHALVSSSRIDREGALLFIDLDNFKTLNDTLGHGIGDLLLQQVALRLESCVRENDTVARLGGDEFVVLLEGLSEQALEAAAQTEAIGEKILAALNLPYLLAEHEYHCTASIGATVFNGNAHAIDDLMKQADIAMYQSKKAGRNTLRFFDLQMQMSIAARASLENELRKALENQEFHLYYQIQVDSSHRPLGAEALIRWIHPERGLVPPAHFIPLVEETELILPIGKWVLETACAQIKAWQQNVLTRDLTLAVNVSAKQFKQADFAVQVQAAVKRHGINPMLLKLELTEGLLLESIEDTIETMNTLNKIGVRLSLDDFGTGYSSLQYLKRLPLDQLKIDQSFVCDLTCDSSDEAIVGTIIAIAHSLNMDVIAEGVETEEQRQLLLNKGCTHYQGYLFGKPVPIDQFELHLKQG
jgi:diguanylate cyclase (GGDEF)-like protein/PAS domain S-box-containing protein